jgi:hypothetical protein
MREVPLSSNPEALKFGDALLEGKFDVVIFLTGVGARALSKVLEAVHSTEKFVEALRKISVVARGPKPVAVLREWNVPIAIAAPEPNTWREVLQEIDDNKLDLRDKHVAVQEYGVSNRELLEGLRDRGALVAPVPVYQWDFSGGSGSAAGRGEFNNRAPHRRGPLHHQRPSQSSLPDCRTSWKKGCSQGRLGGFPPQNGLFSEGGSGAVGSSRSAETPFMTTDGYLSASRPALRNSNRLSAFAGEPRRTAECLTYQLVVSGPLPTRIT